MRAHFRLLLLLLSLAVSNDCARILGVFPFTAPSHYFLGSKLMKGLAEAGHDVTMVSPFRNDNPPKGGKWTEIVLNDFREMTNKLMSKMDLFKMEKSSILSTIFIINKMGPIVSEETLKHPKVQELIHSNEKFDVVIVTQALIDATKALAKHFNAHLILFSNVPANSWLNHLVGNPSLPSFLPDILLHMPDKMSFFQRVQNTIFGIGSSSFLNLYYYPKQGEYIQKYFPSPADMNDALYNVSLVLINSHESIFTAQPRVPCMIEIGGFHVDPPKKLPEDLQAFLDNATQGVIYFSMGSNLKSTNLPQEKKDAILKAFSKRREKVLWKWEDDVLPGQPPNVKLGKWLPQQDILAHPNVKLFITHGGLLSTTETVYHGVPIIAIPIMGDQQMNARIAETSGYGIVLPFSDLSEENLSGLIEEILSNPSYTIVAKERSRIMKDRQIDPLANAIYWVEYVIRHNGAKHLRVPYMELSWYQFYLLDVFSFLFGVAIAAAIIIKKAFSYFCGRRRAITKTKAKIKDN